MQALKELVYLINKHNVRTQSFFPEGPEGKSMMAEFYEEILKGNIQDDEGAAHHFYDGQINSARYQKLKNSMLKRLLSMVFFLDNNGSSFAERNQAYYECYKEWASAKILLGKNARTSGIRLALKVLRQSKKYEFTELTLDISRTLRLHYGTREGNLSKFDQYNKLYKSLAQLWKREIEAEEKYADLVLHYINAKASKDDTHLKAKEFFEEIKEDFNQYDSYMIKFCGYLIKTLISSSINDHQNTLQTTQEALDFFYSKPYFARVPIQIAYYQQMVCYTQLKDFDNGRKVAFKCQEIIDRGSFNWFKFQELYFLLSMHTEEYQEAYEIFCEVKAEKQFEFLPEAVRETWNIFKAYLHFLQEVGQLALPTDEKRFTKFRLGKFLNNTPIFSKDKMGMNIPILVIQIVFMIHNKDYDQAIDRIEAIEKYVTRYLRKDDTFRSNCFIRMLLQIPASGFHQAGVIRKAKKYQNKLEECPLEMAGQNYEIEIIPYETLWNIVVQSLEPSFHTV